MHGKKKKKEKLIPESVPNLFVHFIIPALPYCSRLVGGKIKITTGWVRVYAAEHTTIL